MTAKRTEMVYAGSVQHNGKTAHAYFRLNAGQLEDRAQVYPAPLGDSPPGAVCSYPVDSGGHVQGAAEFIKTWPNEDDVTEWTSRHNAMAASEAAWGSQMPDVFHCLSPIREAYGRLGEEQQGVLIAQVVRYIVNGMTEENGK